MKQKTVGVLFGGQSGEHEISMISATSVAKALREVGYDILYLYIDKEGAWWLQDGIGQDARKLNRLVLSPGDAGGLLRIDQGVSAKNSETSVVRPDVVFPVLHGTRGEDGMIQAMLIGCSLPFVGAGIVGSAITNDKDLTKRLLIEADLSVVPYVALASSEALGYQAAAQRLGTPLWVKPANLGSSLGINCVENEDEYTRALQQAFKLDTKVLLEQNITGRELECSVLQTRAGVVVSQAGEIIVRNKHHFYDYNAKYQSLDKEPSTEDEELVSLKAPTDLPQHLQTEIERIARLAFHLLEGRHIMRVDLFLSADEKLYINEVQTIPGFTSISMYPKLLSAKGIDFSQLVDRLVQDALRNPISLTSSPPISAQKSAS